MMESTRAQQHGIDNRKFKGNKDAVIERLNCRLKDAEDKLYDKDVIIESLRKENGCNRFAF